MKLSEGKYLRMAKKLKGRLKEIINSYVTSRYFFEHSIFNNDLT
jgi:hypothetical protein